MTVPPTISLGNARSFASNARNHNLSGSQSSSVNATNRPEACFAPWFRAAAGPRCGCRTSCVEMRSRNGAITPERSSPPSLTTITSKASLEYCIAASPERHSRTLCGRLRVGIMTENSKAALNRGLRLRGLYDERGFLGSTRSTCGHASSTLPRTDSHSLPQAQLRPGRTGTQPERSRPEPVRRFAWHGARSAGCAGAG